MRWISLEVEKPPYGKTVLVWARSGYVTVRALESKTFMRAGVAVHFDMWESGGLPIESSSHWMPLPDPPDAGLGMRQWDPSLVEAQLRQGTYVPLATDWDTHGESHAG